MNAEEAAYDAGWMKTPQGWWWREIEDGETIVNGDRVRMFLGSGPYVFANDAAGACLADNLEFDDYMRD